MASPPDRVEDTVFGEIRRRILEDNSDAVTDTPVGESVYQRQFTAIGAAAVSGVMRLAGFTARATQNISQVKVVTATTAAAATPTLCRIGVYSRDPSTNLHTLIASTANDTTLFAATTTTYTRSFTNPFLKTAGTDYMVAILIVSGAAMPTFLCPSTGSNAAFQTDFLFTFPMVSASLNAQADLPATIAQASLSATSIYAHALLLQ